MTVDRRMWTDIRTEYGERIVHIARLQKRAEADAQAGRDLPGILLVMTRA